MRKQTKLVAVASAAALLAIGASMTSFAATGWVEEGGEWFYYEKDGSKAEDAWKKSGDKWFWLDSEESGAMAIDKLVDDGDNTYYVDSTGAMVANTWVKVVNEDQDDDDDPAEYNYYYMQSNGKAYKAGDNTSTKFKTIDGKRYAFDEDGKMLYGWVDGNGSRLTGEDDWATENEDVYYCGSWDDGAMKTGWQKIYVHDEVEDEDMEHWFWFKSNGKRYYNDGDENIKEKKINSKKYGFDKRGVMVYEWTLATGDVASTDSWKYFNSPEDGARVTKGWFKVVAANEDNSFGSVIDNIGSKTNPNTFDYDKADDESEKWYYADGDGNLKAGEIAKIKGKYYAFAPTGYMLNGLVFMSVDNEAKITNLYDDGVDSDELDDIMDDTFKGCNDADASLYYFGNDEDADGSMKTGATTVTVDGDSHNFLFSKSGGAEGKGKGLSGIEDNKYIYKYGKKIKADSDDKYEVVAVAGSADTGSDLPGAKVAEIDSSDLRSDIADNATYKNKDDDTVRFAIYEEDRDFYLVNTTGTIIKNKTAAKDGDDWYFYVQDKYIRMYANSKTLSPKMEDGKNVNGTLDLSKWKEFNYKADDTSAKAVDADTTFPSFE